MNYVSFMNIAAQFTLTPLINKCLFTVNRRVQYKTLVFVLESAILVLVGLNTDFSFKLSPS